MLRCFPLFSLGLFLLPVSNFEPGQLIHTHLAHSQLTLTNNKHPRRFGKGGGLFGFFFLLFYLLLLLPWMKSYFIAFGFTYLYSFSPAPLLEPNWVITDDCFLEIFFFAFEIRTFFCMCYIAICRSFSLLVVGGAAHSSIIGGGTWSEQIISRLRSSLFFAAAIAAAV